MVTSASDRRLSLHFTEQTTKQAEALAILICASRITVVNEHLMRSPVFHEGLRHGIFKGGHVRQGDERIEDEHHGNGGETLLMR
jgi:hypothetical protein